jgi:hypothetical protein
MTGREIGTPMRHFGGGGPLRVKSGQTVAGQNLDLSAMVQKRTKTGETELSALCQKQTHALQQNDIAIRSPRRPRQSSRQAGSNRGN